MALVRLQKFLSECGVASRRKAEELITDGKVRVNGQKVTELGTKIDPYKDQVLVKNKPVHMAPKGILLFNKPKGVVSTLSDPENRPCIGDYLSKHYKSYFPVGRLDWDTSGLIILTNDGELAQHLMHPSYEFERLYNVRVEGHLAPKDFEKLELGVTLADGKARCTAKLISQDEKSCWLEVVVKEGRNRFVRRMMDKIRHPVIKLKRLQYGPFNVGKMREGEMMKLTEKQYAHYRERIFRKKAEPKRKGGQPAEKKKTDTK